MCHLYACVFLCSLLLHRVKYTQLRIGAILKKKPRLFGGVSPTIHLDDPVGPNHRSQHYGRAF